MANTARQMGYVPFLNERTQLGSLIDNNGKKIKTAQSGSRLSHRLRARQKDILCGIKRKSIRVSEERDRNMQLFIPNQIEFNENLSTSVVPPIADASLDDPLNETSRSVMMTRSITQPDKIEQN